MGIAEELAIALRDAQKNKQTIKPIRTKIDNKNIGLAYEIQEINIRHRIAAGRRIVGKKIGLTSFAVQKQLGVDQPDFGILLDDMALLNGDSFDANEILQPKAEAEIALVLKSDLKGKHLGITDLINAIDYALPAIEIVGSRIENWDIRITDTIADNASASHFILGHTPTLLTDFDIVNCSMKMSKNGDVVSTGSGKDCMGSPLNALLWLANKMREMDRPLLKGDVILTGALGPMTSIESGDILHASIEGLGTVDFSFK